MITRFKGGAIYWLPQERVAIYASEICRAKPGPCDLIQIALCDRIQCDAREFILSRFSLKGNERPRFKQWWSGSCL